MRQRHSLKENSSLPLRHQRVEPDPRHSLRKSWAGPQGAEAVHTVCPGKQRCLKIFPGRIWKGTDTPSWQSPPTRSQTRVVPVSNALQNQVELPKRLLSDQRTACPIPATDQRFAEPPRPFFRLQRLVQALQQPCRVRRSESRLANRAEGLQVLRLPFRASRRSTSFCHK